METQDQTKFLLAVQKAASDEGIPLIADYAGHFQGIPDLHFFHYDYGLDLSNDEILLIVLIVLDEARKCGVSLVYTNDPIVFRT